MIKEILQRICLMCFILFGVLSVTFFISRCLPSSPVELMLGSKPNAQQIAEAEQALGLDKPLFEQYLIYIQNAIKGDFGNSLITKQPVIKDIFLRATATFELVTLSLIISLSIGIPCGINSAIKKEKLFDHSCRILAVSGVAIPIFFLGLALQIIFAGHLDLLPLQGRINDIILLDHPFKSITGLYLIDSLINGNIDAFISSLRHLILPVLTLSFASIATIIRISRSLMIEALNQDYVQSMKAYGVNDRKINYIYAFKATLIPLLTVIGLTYGFMLGGSIIVEYVFDWPGVGGYMVQALLNNDFNAVMGVTFFIAFSYLLINLIVDLSYQFLDPRLKK